MRTRRGNAGEEQRPRVGSKLPSITKAAREQHRAAFLYFITKRKAPVARGVKFVVVPPARVAAAAEAAAACLYNRESQRIQRVRYDKRSARRGFRSERARRLSRKRSQPNGIQPSELIVRPHSRPVAELFGHQLDVPDAGALAVHLDEVRRIDRPRRVDAKDALRYQPAGPRL